MKKVMLFGTFDYLHPGHLNLFTQAKKLGDYLIVVVATDQNAQKAKGEKPHFNQWDRLTTVSKAPGVDKAIIGSSNMDYLTTIKNEDPQVIALGYDQQFSATHLQKQLHTEGLNIKVVRLKPFRPDKFKSSLLKKGKL